VLVAVWVDFPAVMKTCVSSAERTRHPPSSPAV
jgi:hypothetical protein